MLKIGIFTTTIRNDRNGIKIANWLLDYANKNIDDVEFELVDLKDYDLPLLGNAPTEDQMKNLTNWKQKHEELDGYVLVMAEYNHSAPGVYKNASDYIKPETNNKALAYVGYGSLGASASIDHHRATASIQGLATIPRTVNFSIFTDFSSECVFDPNMNLHKNNLEGMFDTLIKWSKALKSIR